MSAYPAVSSAYRDGYALGKRNTLENTGHGERAVSHLASLPLLSDMARGYLDGARDALREEGNR